MEIKNLLYLKDATFGFLKPFWLFLSFLASEIFACLFQLFLKNFEIFAEITIKMRFKRVKR